MFSTGPARGKAYARTRTGVESRVAALGRADRNLGSRRAFLSGKVVSAV